MINTIQKLVALMMNKVRVNHVWRIDRQGQVLIIKKRRRCGGVVIWFGNWFLALASSGVSMFVNTADWIAWEIHSVHLLYPGSPAVSEGDNRSVALPEFPGVSLRRLINVAVPEIQAFGAAARELRRAHQIECDFFQATWSHGDLHLDNILYDSRTGMAFLIDFDTRHNKEVAPAQRHCDDLKVFLLELITLPGKTWHDPARAFLGAYKEPGVLEALSQQLAPPRGFARILWYTRTNYMAVSRYCDCMEVLAAIIREELAQQRT